MIELYLTKVTENSEREQAGKTYARVDYKETLSVQDMARHMAEHNTAFSEGSITGILIDFVKCIREQVLNGNTVKIDNLAIFKATVEANPLEVLYDAEQDKVAQATIGFTRDELKKSVKLGWTDKAKAEIAQPREASPPTPLQRARGVITPEALAIPVAAATVAAAVSSREAIKG